MITTISLIHDGCCPGVAAMRRPSVGAEASGAGRNLGRRGGGEGRVEDGDLLAQR
jgi:hypothetical protein